MNEIRVLIIDDSQQIRDFLIEYILEPKGFFIDIAVDGAEGLQKALTNPPDLILLDFEMPRMTGPEVLRELRDRGSKIPVILMTARGSEELAVEVFRLGVYNYVPKPFQPEEMTMLIDEALAVAHLSRERDALVSRVAQTNQELEQRLNELNTMYQVGKSITTLVEPNSMLERLVDAVLSVTQAERCMLDLVDPQSGKILKQLSKEKSTAKKNGEERVLSVALQMGDRVVGTLSITKRSTKEFSSHDDRLLRMLADYAAIAIHNMQLMYQLQRTKDHEKKQIRDLFERYVAPSLVEQMLARPDLVRLGGTREKVAIIFADVRGFSAFSNTISPETLVELLNQYMRVAADAILDEEGTLDKFMGDAVMAFFNAPLPQEDYPLRAVRAAWTLQQSVAEVHAHLPAKYHLYFGVGVGVGEAVVGNIGTPQMMNFTVIGDAVNKVKRLQENAKGGQILIDTKTYQMVQQHVRARNIGHIHLKGQQTSEPVYEVLGVSEFDDNFEEEVGDIVADWSDYANYSAKV